jgi:hypothetical protein
MREALDRAFAGFVRECMSHLATLHPSEQWVVDNTSRQLWPYLPGAHHVHVRRDVRDVIVSWTFHQLANDLVIGEPRGRGSLILPLTSSVIAIISSRTRWSFFATRNGCV